MSFPMGGSELRGQPRVNAEFPATISVGSQLTVKGHLKDLSLNSAFIRIKNSIYLNVNDEVGVSIQCSEDEDNEKEMIQGQARVSRIVPGEGLVVYFTKIDDNSLKCIKKLLPKTAV